VELLIGFFILVYAVDILLLFYYGLHAYAMVGLYLKNNHRCQSDSQENKNLLAKSKMRGWPKVTIQLPMFNEYYVIDRLIDATIKLDYPKNKLEIQILDDSTDDSRLVAQKKVKEYKKKGFDITYIHRTNRDGHKAGAMREATKVAKGQYIAVFDADFLPNPQFLKKTVPHFFTNPNIGMVQTRWSHINEDYSILTKAQSIGIDGHFMVEQVARNGSDLWMNFNGTAGIWNRECIEDAGGWQSDTLTEDFDLSYRAELKGWKFKYLTDIANPAELPATVQAFKTQQFRWCKGSIQTAVKLIPRIWKSNESWKIKLEALTHLTNYSVHPLMIINILVTLPLLLFHERFEHISLAVLFGAAFILSIGTFGPMVFYAVSQRALHKDWKHRMLWLPVLTMIGTGVAINNTRAWIEAVIGKKSEFVRTPKLKIESQKDKVAERSRYKTKKIDNNAYLELLMAFYITFTIVTAFIVDKWFVVPFLALYAAGFYYVSFYTFLETFKLNRDSRKNEEKKAQQTKAKI